VSTSTRGPEPRRVAELFGAPPVALRRRARERDPAARSIPIGRARSGVLELAHDDQGREIERRVFDPPLASRIVTTLLTGAPTPYAWCEDAVQAAVCRRRILAQLVSLWFGGLVRLPFCYGAGWHRARRTFELHAERVTGRRVPLKAPGSSVGWELFDELSFEVMQPLQARLREAGFEGLLWQAGFGNPAAAAHFLLERTPEGRRRWVWTDLESGVPALFALDPRALVRFYLPRSLRLRRLLYDDVDTARLRGYVERHRHRLRQEIGAPAVEELVRDIERLEQHQRRWKSLERYRRSIEAHLVKGRIDRPLATSYLGRWALWYLRLSALALASLAAALPRLAWRGLTALWAVRWRRHAVAARDFLASPAARQRAGRSWILARIREWRQRGFLERGPGARLRDDLFREADVPELGDLAVHVALVPAVRALRCTGIPVLLFVGGALPLAGAALLLVAGGALARTLYTTWRVGSRLARRERAPWLAWWLGMLPFLGRAAFPAEIAARRALRSSRLAHFILYEAAAGIGRSLPVWGGRDSAAEHRANRLPDPLLRRVRPVA
jgi:hypothetical protein